MVEGDRDAFVGWVFTLARRELIGHRRKEGRRRTDPAPSEVFSDRVALDEPESVVADALAADEALRRLTECLPADQAEFKALNAELTKIWPVITEKKDMPADAKSWDGKPGKRELIER